MFLTHSAATIGGVAMASTVVDELLAGASTAVVGVNKGKPKLGGTLKVGLSSDVSNYHIFNGAQGKMDSSGFNVANALYDPLFVSSKNGKTWLPMLALSATPNSNYTVWTVKLRQGVSFTNGDPFNADVVLQNFQAAANDQTVGLAVKPIISSVTKVDGFTVAFNLNIPYSTFPYGALSEQQVCYVAHPTSFSPSFTGTPIGTGPFMVTSWQVGVQSVFAKNPNYWRKDAAGRTLPYLNGIIFKTIVDDSARNQALQTGAIDIMFTEDGTGIAGLKKLKGIQMRTDEHDPRDESTNCMIVNTTGTMNQYFAWAGYLTSFNVRGAAPFLAKGLPVPPDVQNGILTAVAGAVDPGTLQWNPSLKPVLNDITIRRACAMAINRSTYLKVVYAGIGMQSDSVYRPSSPYYAKASYPAYNPKAAKKLVNAYKQKNGLSSVGFVIDIVAGSSSQQKAFAFLRQQLGAIGITVNARPLNAAALILNVILGQYDCAQWNQFGGAEPALNYVWFSSQSATAAPPVGLGLDALPAGTQIAGAVNFAHQHDPVIENAMLRAMASRPGSATYISSWKTVGTQLSKNIPYLMLTKIVTAWAARNNVQNWAFATSADGHTQCMSPDGGSNRWDQIWKK